MADGADGAEGDGWGTVPLSAVIECLRSFFDQYHNRVLDRFDKPIRTKEEMSNFLRGSFEDLYMVAPAPSPTGMEVECEAYEARYRLEFTHDCIATACAEDKCPLCENNPKRRCGSQCFKKKYFMQEIIVARCGAPMRVRLVDVQTNETARIDTKVEACILNGPDYVQYFTDGIPNCAVENLESCQEKWYNDQKNALLQSAIASNNSKSGLVEFRLKGGEAELPKLKVMHSSEALLGGRRTPFRLLIGVTTSGGLEPTLVEPAVTDEFVVATQRSKLAQKKDVPLKHDQVSTLEQMGGQRVETLSRLGDILMKQLELSKLPRGWPKHVDTVDDFLKLAQAVKLDSRLRKKVTSLLRMSDNQWAEACEHALVAVPADSRLRVWWHQNDDNEGTTVGLLYSCTLGEVDLTKPQGWVEVDHQSYSCVTYDLAFPEEQERMQKLHRQAKENWSKPRHPGWGIYPTTQDFTSQDFQRNPNMLPSPPPRCVAPVRRKRRHCEMGVVPTTSNPMMVGFFPGVVSVPEGMPVAMGGHHPLPSAAPAPPPVPAPTSPEERSAKVVIVTHPPSPQAAPAPQPDPEPVKERSPSPVPEVEAGPPTSRSTDVEAPPAEVGPIGTSLDELRMKQRLEEQKKKVEEQKQKKAEGRSAELKVCTDFSCFFNVTKSTA